MSWIAQSVAQFVVTIEILNQEGKLDEDITPIIEWRSKVRRTSKITWLHTGIWNYIYKKKIKESLVRANRLEVFFNQPKIDINNIKIIKAWRTQFNLSWNTTKSHIKTRILFNKTKRSSSIGIVQTQEFKETLVSLWSIKKQKEITFSLWNWFIESPLTSLEIV